MIDTDKYEGHDDWEGTKVNMNNEANAQLIADAPLLLAEVKRLREENKKLRKFVKNIEWGLDEINKEYKEIKKVIE